MMETRLEEQLDDRYGGARIKELARRLHHDGEGINALCNIMLHCGKMVAARNAAWVLANLPQDDKLIYLQSRYDEIAVFAMSPDCPFRRGMVLSLLIDLQTADNFRGDLFDFCLQHLGDKRESGSTRAYMIHLAAKMCRLYPELSIELISSLDCLALDTTPSIASARRNALRRIRMPRHV